MKSLVYVTVRIVVEHPDNVEPTEVIQECDYNFEADASRQGEQILETSIEDVEDHGECDTAGYLLEEQRRDEKKGLYGGVIDPAN